ncbi:sensor histidine kinase [Gloeothece verrucosa]|uniref:histidine kinase n=1 Tax=Gloeothece verrucosa (strain PCC 7822) TaxID=497965 RepID=E0UGH4_GLOV7|nr:GAF domain-containing sensor histidine kinase [Gloeothece verrucosa]ADN12069.1 GAF sensor signal transduction histidine kinase [Gloeothece verrucosa PCC 7822]
MNPHLGRDIQPVSQGQTSQEELIAAIALRIRQSLDLDEILGQTVTEVRQCLKTDRVLIYRFESDGQGVMAVESVIEPFKAVLGEKVEDPCFNAQQRDLYRQGRIQVLEDIQAAKLHPCYGNLLLKYQVRANLVVPIVAEEKLWGLLIAQHCRCSHQWELWEINLLKQLATQVAIAVQQAELHHQLKLFNAALELQVKERTEKLEQSLRFESLIHLITEKIRDSLDEGQILQTVTQELGQVLELERCKIELYDNEHTTATIVYECTQQAPTCQGICRKISDFPELYQQLLQKQPLQFVERIPELAPEQKQATRLVCPIFDNQGNLGNLWLIRPREQGFEELEIGLVQQVANECAIAIRQARLYEASQTQVRELEKLNNLKDNFLKTISHELRTPMSSILLAAETLEKLIEIEQEEGRLKSSQRFNQVLEIFKESCQQQNKLVNDLLTLCYIDADSTTLFPDWIDLRIWLPEIVQPFLSKTGSQQQHLILDISPSILPFECDISTLERIVIELLNNACKYSPKGETITVAAWMKDNNILISVINSGVEIPAEEFERIFDQFYRIPKADPWRYNGTGIGLTLVRKLVGLLGATIEVESQNGKTSFTVQIPLES